MSESFLKQLYCQNLKCQAVLSGKLKRFCSTRCKSAFYNPSTQNYASQKQRGTTRKLQLIDMMGGGCNICGYNKNIAALEFHHIDPATKDAQITLRTLSNNNWDYILSEANKCRLLCSNCHRELHHPLMSRQSLQISIQPLIERPVKKKLERMKCHICHGKLSSGTGACRSCDAKTRVSESKKCSCGEIKGSRSKTCKSGYVRKLKTDREPKMYCRVVDRPDKEALSAMVWQKSIEQLGRDYGVSGNAIRKWCKSYGINHLPQVGYWAKVKAGKVSCD